MNLRFKRLKELIAYFFKTLKTDGVKETFNKTLRFFAMRRKRKGRFLPGAALLARQREEGLCGPLISVVTALYNTDTGFLKEYISSVLAQTYQNFELCLADASTIGHPEVEETVKKFKSEKIKYIKLAENGGISSNGNAAAAIASGEYLAFADHDDILAANALYEMAKRINATSAQVLYSDEALFEKTPAMAHVGHFKPDFAPDYLNSCNYICHLLVVNKELFFAAGALRSEFDGAQDHDLLLRLAEREVKFEHLQTVLYFWRVHAGSTSGGGVAKPYAELAGKKAVEQHLANIGAAATVEAGPFSGTYRVKYAPPAGALVSILIPSKDHIEDLEKALTSVYKKTDYKNFEVIIIENNSEKPETFAYYEEAKKRFANLGVVVYSGPFNYSAVNNFGRRAAKGQYLLLLNNDVDVICEGWLTEMLGYCAQPGVGAVGAKLLYEDGTVQHAGVITGLGGVAGHSHKYFQDGKSGYMFRLAVAQNLSAVTGACLLVKADVFDTLCGLDEKFAVAFNDVDFCLRVRGLGLRIVYTPFAKLYHYESKSRGLDKAGAAKTRFESERAMLRQRYGSALLKDPYYSPFLTLDMENFAEAAVLPREE